MQTMLKQTFFEAVIVLSLSVILCLVVTTLRPQGLNLFRLVPEKNKPADPLTGTNAISLAEALQHFGDGKTLFADARSPRIMRPVISRTHAPWRFIDSTRGLPAF